MSACYAPGCDTQARRRWAGGMTVMCFAVMTERALQSQKPQFQNTNLGTPM